MSSVGQVRDVRVIADPRTKKCKGVAYVEFKAPESVALAIGLTGQKLLGIPIQVGPIPIPTQVGPILSVRPSVTLRLK